MGGFESTEEMVLFFLSSHMGYFWLFVFYLFFFRNLNSKVERSQSCSDTAQDRAKSRLRAAPTSKAKVYIRHSFWGSLVPSGNHKRSHSRGEDAEGVWGILVVLEDFTNRCEWRKRVGISSQVGGMRVGRRTFLKVLGKFLSYRLPTLLF